MLALRLASVLLPIAALLACGTPDEGSTDPVTSGCTAGESFPCACSTGATGTQICQPNGTLAACQCAPLAGPTSTAPIPVSPAPTVPNPTPDPTAPNPTTPNPTMPAPTTPNPTMPAPTTPNPTTPAPTTPDPTPPDPAPPGMTSGCGSTNYPPSGSGRMDVQGVQRDYIVTLPAGYDPNRPYKLVFVWHALGGNMQSTAAGYMGFAAAAGGSAIFATGQGLGSIAGWGDANDIPFARQLFDHVTANYCVDGARVFSAGFSFGAIMSNRVGCELGDVITAIAPGAGGGPRPAPCVGETAVWITHGSTDGIVPYSSGLDSLDHWVTRNGCSQQTTPTGVDQCVRYQGCQPNAPVVWCPTTLNHLPPSYFVAEAWKFFSEF